MPGENGLVVKDEVPVLFIVMSVIRTTLGVQGTLVFQENGELGLDASTLGEGMGTKANVERTRIAKLRDRATALLLRRVPH